MAIIKYKNPQNNEFETVEIAGGSSVIANPDEAAAADLNKIQIDDVIYNVVGSGGGGTSTQKIQHGTFSREWPGQSGISINIDFDEPMKNTNYTVVLTRIAPVGSYWAEVELEVSEKRLDGFTINGWTEYTCSVMGVDWCAIPDEIVSSGGGGTGKVEMQRTLINRTTTKSSTPVNNFSDDNGNLYKISDFDLLYFQLYRETTGYPPWYPDSGFCFIEDFIDSQYGLSYNNGTSRSAIAIYSSDTAILYNDTFTGIDAVEVYGIKLVGSGGGNTITPNPEEDATETLNKIKIDDTVYNIEGGGGGGSSALVEKTKEEYDALSAAEKTNGNAYFVKEEDAQESFDMSSIKVFKEASMSITSNETNTNIVWNGGSAIGLTYYYIEKIDLSNISKITYDLETGSCYGGGATAQQERWYLNVALMTTLPTTNSSPNHDDMLAYKEYSNSNTNYNNQEIDTSNLSDECYIVVYAHGWNATLSNIKYDGIEKRCIYYKDEVYSGNCNVSVNQIVNGGITSFYNAIIPIHSDYSSEVGTISASSEYSDREAWHAINGEEDNVYVGTGYWQAASYNPTQWIEYDFNETQSIDRLTYRYVNRACTSNTLQFQYWNGTEWITVVEKSDYPTTSASAPFLQPFEHEFDTITTNKIRIFITLDGSYEQILSSWQVYRKNPIYAKNIIFDNEGTEIESTNVQDAIIEASQGGGTGLLDYSITEQDLGIKWIDGRKIYRKCFSDLTTGSTPHNIENFGQPTKIEIIGKANNGDFISLNYHNSQYSAGVYAVIDSTNIKINQASMSETFTFDVILEYVKNE